jgi:ABC-type uncharacterized transport system auxiliary subunit
MTGRRHMKIRSVLCLAAVFAALGGCGGKEEETPAATGTPQNSAVQSVPMGSGGQQQQMSGVQKPRFDNSK